MIRTILKLLRGHRSTPVIVQTESSECALTCIAMILAHHGNMVSMQSFRQRFHTSVNGTSLAHAIRIAEAMNLDTRAVRADIDQLHQLDLPCVIHWNLNHFVVLTKVAKRWIYINDPLHGRRRLSLTDVSKSFTGVALELTPGLSFRRGDERVRLSIRKLTGPIGGIRTAALQVVLLAGVIEALSLAVPYQIQWVLDHYSKSFDQAALMLVSIAFLFLVTVRMVLSFIRGWLLSWLGATLNSQWFSHVFSHLLKLPLAYFEKRRIGDVVSRFNSLNTMQATMTGKFAEALIDGCMATFGIVILLCYNLRLTVVLMAVFSAYIFFRLITYKRLWDINEDYVMHVARQQSELIESIRGVQAIKLANKQADRSMRMNNHSVVTSMSDMLNQRATISFGAVSQWLSATQRVIIIGLGGLMAIRGHFSFGMLFAYVAYADQCAAKLNGLVDKVMDFRVLKLHAHRIEDIVLSEPEQGEPSNCVRVPQNISIALSNLGFRYSEQDPWIFRHLNATFLAGESVAIVGRSGCGKSTLVKLLVGLLNPCEGSIEINGTSIQEYGLHTYRSMIGVVMQDDQLFTGTIAENISFFDHVDTEIGVISAARAAAIHDDIMSLPMQYETLVGDMGSSLSGGQKQRLLLARALYRNPRVLVLDEATSHLDAQNEASINSSIRNLKLTRIIIAHRRETIGSADRVLNLDIMRRPAGSSPFQKLE